MTLFVVELRCRSTAKTIYIYIYCLCVLQVESDLDFVTGSESVTVLPGKDCAVRDVRQTTAARAV